MIEVHPIKPFIPEDSKYLLLGSFPGKITSLKSDWYYGTQRTQFWKILESVYDTQLADKQSKINLFSKLKMAITDVIYSCERNKGTNLDNNLTNIVYNTKAIDRILKENKIEKIFFSSKFVENKFTRLYKNLDIKQVTLPSPSPRYAKLTLMQKIRVYKKLLPKID